MSFTGNEDHSITLAQGAVLTKRYRDSVTAGTTIGHYIGKTAITNILAQTGCVGLRVYYAINDAGQKQLVVVGVQADGNDLYNGLLADRTFNCPSDCSSNNPLNTSTT